MLAHCGSGWRRARRLKGPTMANKRNVKKGSTSRDAGSFVALPWSVLDSAAYAALSHTARSLLIAFARQYCRDNNGRLLASSAYLKKRGWNSSDVITRAKNELVSGGFIHQTVMGHRPNKASWYAVTWQTLDRLPGYDAGAVESFERSAYLKKNAPLIPSGGVGGTPIVPSGGVGQPRPTPSGGAIRPVLSAPPTPSDGNHLEKPSPAAADPVSTGSAAPGRHDTGPTEMDPPQGPGIETLKVARQAQQHAVDRHARRTSRTAVSASAPTDEGDYTRVRDEHAHDMSDWH